MFFIKSIKELKYQIELLWNCIDNNRKRLTKLEEQCNVTYSETINPNYENTMAMCGTSHPTKTVYYHKNDILYEGQYVIYTGWLYYEIRKAKSYKDIMKSVDDNTFAGVVRKQMQGPGLVEIYVTRERKK